jgi:EAL domain-containing protein (putative c-di-GMP-specific phosphodiesterase class I)
MGVNQAPVSVIRSAQYLRELLTQHQVRILFQPIVALDPPGQVLGFEALARGTHRELSVQPGELFRLADQCGMATDLSRLFREAAVEESLLLTDGECLFLNLHPAELSGHGLLESLAELKGRMGNRAIVLEINEHAIADLDTMRRLGRELRNLGIRLAYDDFGAGQARFLELAEVPPDFIKLDMRLVRGIEVADARRALLLALNRASAELGVAIIAEGIETAIEAEVCRQMGCQFGQGYHFGPPEAASALASRRQDTRRIDATQVRALVKAYSATRTARRLRKR